MPTKTKMHSAKTHARENKKNKTTAEKNKTILSGKAFVVDLGLKRGKEKPLKGVVVVGTS
jgi:hypothetical protein